MPRRAGRAIHHRGGPDRRTGPPGRTTRHPSRRTALRQRTRISLCRNDRLGERSYRPALHPARRTLAQRLRRVLQLPSARRMPQHQHLLVPDPGPSRHRRLEIRLQQPPPTLSPGIPTPRPLRCHLYPPMNDSHPSWTNSRGPATSAPAAPTRTTRLCPASLHHAVKSLTQSLTPDGLWVSETTAKWPESASAANHILIFVADSPRIRHYCEKSAILFENLICEQICQEAGESRPGWEAGAAF